MTRALALLANKNWCCTCGNEPCDGLDCGVYLPGQAPRQKAAPKSADEMRAIRAKAWATRRAARTLALLALLTLTACIERPRPITASDMEQIARDLTPPREYR